MNDRLDDLQSRPKMDCCANPHTMYVTMCTACLGATEGRCERYGREQGAKAGAEGERLGTAKGLRMTIAKLRKNAAYIIGDRYTHGMVDALTDLAEMLESPPSRAREDRLGEPSCRDTTENPAPQNPPTGDSPTTRNSS